MIAIEVRTVVPV